MEIEHPSVPHDHEIACDESGWEGTNLVAANSDVIAYASVRLSAETAAECLTELGGRASTVRREYKASHVLRADRASLARLLGPAGPLHGNAFVHLTDKAHFVVGRVFDLVLGQSADTASAGLSPDPRLAAYAVALSQEGPEAYGRERWQAFLVTGQELLRKRRSWTVREPVDAFFDLVDVLAKVDGDSRLGGIFDELRSARPTAYATRERLIDDQMVQPVLEPLIPALARTVLHWTRGGTAGVSIVHDEQSALTVRRVQRLERQLLQPGHCLRFRQVDSRTEPRVQMADVLAGVARRLASEELHGHGDAELGELLRAYIDPASCWADERSWSRLSPS